jgi:aspartate/methionine/tyrosine aminotransferase
MSKCSASPGVQLVLQSIIANHNVGVMIPIPQYPLYTAAISLFEGKAVPYYLDEDNDWGLSVRQSFGSLFVLIPIIFKVKELDHSLREARLMGIDVRALCIINPGNPTGQCLSEKNISEVRMT